MADIVDGFFEDTLHNALRSVISRTRALFRHFSHQ